MTGSDHPEEISQVPSGGSVNLADVDEPLPTIEAKITFHNSEKFMQLVATELKDILNMASRSSLSHQSFSCSFPSRLLPSSIVNLFGTILNPTSSLDCLLYTYPQRFSSLFFGISTIYSECIHLLLCKEILQPSVPSLIVAILDSITLEYYNAVEVLQQVTPTFSFQYLRNIHQEIVTNLQRISSQIDHLFEPSDLSSSDETSQSLKEDVNRLTYCFNEIAELFGTYSYDYLQDLLTHAAVLFSTLSSSGNSVMKSCHSPSQSIDVLIVDEAGQCLESELLIPFYTNPLHLVLIGDPKQLPATVLSHQAQKLHLGDSSLARLMNHCQAPYDILTTQYRMHPDICLFPNQQFYNNQLQTASQVLRRPSLTNYLKNNFTSVEPNPLGWLGSYLWIDVSGSESTGGSFGKSRANLTEATVIARYWNLSIITS